VTIAFDALTMGRIGVDIYPLQTGVSLREVRNFGYLGAAPPTSRSPLPATGAVPR
jgi:5-dehydro-2-deoxygluconokinase